MKNKVSSTILFIAVAAIWGYIIYYIYDAVKEDDEPAMGYSLAQKISPKDSLKDDFSLLLDYPDPFLKKNQKVEASDKPFKAKPLIGSYQQMGPDWNRISYSGTIENKKQKGKRMAIINIDSSTYFVSANTSVHELKLLVVYPDSVLISLEGEKKWIKKLE